VKERSGGCSDSFMLAVLELGIISDNTEQRQTQGHFNAVLFISESKILANIRKLIWNAVCILCQIVSINPESV